MSSTNPPRASRLAIMLPRLSRYGGAERFGWRLAEALAQTGHRVDFLCARQEDEAPPGVTPVILGRPRLTKAVKMAWFAHAAERARNNSGYDLSIGLGKTWQQDILRVGGGPLSVFWRLSQLAYSPGLPRAVKMLRRRTSPANWLTHAIEPAQLRRSRVIVAVSHAVRRWLVETYPWLNENAIRVVYNQPDLTQFSPPAPDQRLRLRRNAGIAPGQYCLGTAGTNFALKGLGTLLHALVSLPDPFVLHVAGGRNPQRWQRLAAELGIADRVHFLGRVNDMPAFYRSLDVFALPSFYDACANAVPEALACGVPTVSSITNGSSAFLDPRFVIDAADHIALANAIQHAADGPAPTPLTPKNAALGLRPYLQLVDELLTNS